MDPVPFSMAQQTYDPEIPVASLREHPENYNVGAVEAIAESLDQHGWYGAVIVQRSTGAIIAGNHRFRAAVAKGAETLPGFVLDVDDEEARRILSNDNRTTQLATFDEEKLVSLLAGVRDRTGTLLGTGYDDKALEALLRATGGSGQGDGDRDPDDAPEPPPEPVTRPGDLWRLGPHRLLCGDATSEADVGRVTGATGEPGIVYTDPPYGLGIVKPTGNVGGYDPASGGSPFGGKAKIGSGKGGSLARNTWFLPVTGDETTDTASAAFVLQRARFPAAAHVWWGGNHYAASAGLPDASCWLVWDKDNYGNDFADCELAWTSHPGAVRMLKHTWNGMLRASERGKRIHPTQKPVALAVWAFSVVDAKNERGIVFDGFGGSGSTLIAAHNTGRVAGVIETEPVYCDVICKRFEEWAGVTPELER